MKILCAGDVCGRFDVLYARVQRLNESKHGPFDALFCVGRTFSDQNDIDAYLNGTKTAPIATYFVTSDRNVPQFLDSAEGREICTNIIYLGQAGIKQVSELKVAFLSGGYDEDAYRLERSDHPRRFYTQANLQTLVGCSKEAGFNGVDILLTSEWGQDVHLNTAQTLERALTGSKAVSDIAIALRPRYHFCGNEGLFWERPPYANQHSHTTRFISLGSVPEIKISDKRRKWLHALNLTPMASLTSEQLLRRPPGTTPSPYLPSDEPRPDSEAQSLEKPVKKKQRLAGVTPDMIQRLEAENEWLSSGKGSSSFFFNVNNSRKGKGGSRPANFTPKKGDAGGMEDHKVYVGGVSFNVDGNQLWDVFSKFGEVLEAKIVMDKINPHHSRGFGFVTFATAESAHRAVAEMDGHLLDGRAIRVNESNKREPKVNTSQNNQPTADLFDARRRTECWFCLASEKVETWLISSIGEEVYLSQPKGAILPDDQLIVPIEHIPCCAAASPSCWAEMMRFKNALLQYYRSKGCGMALFERYTSTAGTTHAYLNAVPVPIDGITALQDMYIQYGAKWQISFEMQPSTFSLPQEVGKGHYFYVELLGAKEQPPIRLLHRVVGRFRLQFGREVCSQLLKMPDRADWKACVVSKEEEEKLTIGFKQNFKRFDFTLDT